MTIGDTLEIISDFFATAFGPLAGSTESPESATGLLESIGYVDLPSVPDALLDLQLSMEGLLDARGELIEARIGFSDGTRDADAVGAALAAVAAQLTLLVNDIHRLPDAFRAQLPAAYLAQTGIADQVEERLLDLLVYGALDELFPRLRRVFSLLGILEELPLEADPSRHQPDFVLFQVHWNRLSTLLRGPEDVLRDTYGWGTPNLDTEKLFRALQDLSIGLLSVPEIRFPSDTFLAAIAPDGVVSETDGPEPMLVVPLAAAGGLGLDLGVLAVPKQTDAELQALGFHLIGAASLAQSLEIGPSVFFDLRADLDLVAGVGAALRPNQGLTLVSNPDGTPVAFAGGMVVGRVSRRLASEEEPIRLLTIPGGPFFDAEELFIRAGVDATTSPADLFVETGIVGGRFVIPSDGADSFTKSFLPAAGVIVHLDLGLGWSQRRGIYFTGSGGLETIITVNATLGPFRIDFVRLFIGVDDGGLALAAGVVGGGSVGPVTVTVDALGIDANLRLTPGNLGPLQLDLGLSVPRGYGVQIDAGGVRGGGFLFFGEGRYSGVLELSVYGIAVKAFGLVETVMPDGREGFSFVIVIVAEFTPIQLGFGFTLLGVGGLVGIHRSVDSQGLGDAVRTGSLAHLLFPRNPVQDAPAIIHDLATVFPATPGHFILGPMAKLGWGTPTLISADLGIILELPGPRLAVLGVIRMQLPSPAFAILSLNLSVSGLLDFPAKLFSLDASLYDSFVAGFTVTGDMAFRLGFGDNAAFLLSVGGFNAGYSPPPKFPELRPVAVDLGVNGNPSLTTSGYFALTSNTAQIGSKIELRASGYGIRLNGWFGFDVLFVFSPFSFTASISAGVRVSFHGVGFGITLRGSLSGPTPWHINGRVCVSVLWWDACLPISVTFGRREPAALPELNPWEGSGQVDDPRLKVVGLSEAVVDPRNWSGSPPPAGFAVVVLAPAATVDRTPIDPMGAATLRQRVLPLNRTLEKFGEYRPVVYDHFDVTTVRLNDVDLNGDGIPDDVPYDVVTDDFAPAHFTELSGADRLSASSYEKMDAGVSIAPNVVRSGVAGSQVLEYETAFITASGETFRDGPSDPRFKLSQEQLFAMLERSASALKGVRRTGNQRYMPRLGQQKR